MLGTPTERNPNGDMKQLVVTVFVPVTECFVREAKTEGQIAAQLVRDNLEQVA